MPAAYGSSSDGDRVIVCFFDLNSVEAPIHCKSAKSIFCGLKRAIYYATRSVTRRGY